MVGEIHSGVTTPMLQRRPAGVAPSPPLGWMNVLVHGDKWFKYVYQWNEMLFEACVSWGFEVRSL